MSAETDLRFENELKMALAQYGKILTELDKIELQKEEMRDKIKSWMTMNKIKEFETLDSTNKQLWKLAISDVSKRSTNYDLLQQAYPDAYRECVKDTPNQRFDCKKIKKKKSSSRPKAAKGKIN